MKNKIISVALIFILVFGYVGLCKTLSGGTKADYGLAEENIQFSEGVGNDITEAVKTSNDYTVLENENYIMKMTSSSNITIVSKKNGRVWNAVPTDNMGNSKYDASVVLNYYVTNSTQKTIYSSSDSVDKEQFKVFKNENGVRVEYIFGEMTSKYVYPEIISKKRLESFLNKMEESDKEFILRRYTLYVLSEYRDAEKDYLLSQYPRLKKEDLYVLNDQALQHVGKRMDAIFRDAGYTNEDRINDISGSDIQRDNPQTFRIAVDYSLTSQGFKAKIDFKNCSIYNEYPIEKIQLLPYFDSYLETDTGYIVLPSGSGALKVMDANKRDEERYLLPVYGKNLTLDSNDDIYENQCSLPVFGSYKNNSGYMCILTEGEQQAYINAEISPIYSSVYPSYMMIDNQLAVLQAESQIWLSAKERAMDALEAEYILFPEMSFDEAYSEMARVYRERLIDVGILSEKNKESEIGLLANIINTVNYDTMLANCFPINKEFAMTTFDETEEIVDDLLKFVDADNLNVLISGWNKKGVGMQKMNRITYSKAAGGKKGLSSLQKSLNEMGVKSYLNIDFNLIKPHQFDGFKSDLHSTRDVNNSIVRYNLYKAKISDFKSTKLQLLSPKTFEENCNSYINNSAFDYSGVNVSQLTGYLYSDYANGEYISRNDTIGIVNNVLKNINEKDISLIGDGANLYVLKNLNNLNNIAVSSADDVFFDRDIPFVHLVLHGYKNYFAKPINDVTLTKQMILKYIETGSGISCRLSKNLFEDLFDTEYEYLYDIKFSELSDSLKDCYTTVSTALKGLNNKSIVSHKYLNSNVVEVKYEDGTIIIINYGDTKYNYNGNLCDSLDYCRIN